MTQDKKETTTPTKKKDATSAGIEKMPYRSRKSTKVVQHLENGKTKTQSFVMPTEMDHAHARKLLTACIVHPQPETRTSQPP